MRLDEEVVSEDRVEEKPTSRYADSEERVSDYDTAQEFREDR